MGAVDRKRTGLTTEIRETGEVRPEGIQRGTKRGTIPQEREN